MGLSQEEKKNGLLNLKGLLKRWTQTERVPRNRWRKLKDPGEDSNRQEEEVRGFCDSEEGRGRVGKSDDSVPVLKEVGWAAEHPNK